MSNIIAWIEAVAESGEAPDPDRFRGAEPDSESSDGTSHGVNPEHAPSEDLPARQFPATAQSTPGEGETPPTPEPLDEIDEWFELDRRRRIYRKRTVAMLRRYMRYSLETGRLPSVIGREFFRSKVTSYRVTTFEDRVIFVHDMETCLQRLDELSRQVLARIVLQEYEHEEAAQLVGCTRMTIHRRLMEALDKMSEILLTAGLLEGIPVNLEKSCQGGKSDVFCASDEEQRK